jgi:hypothetical protein
MTWDGKFVNYPKFKWEWQAYRQSFHPMVGNDLVAKTLREKCVSGDAQKMIGNVEDLAEIWDTLETCYERQEKYVTEAPKAILEFRRYRMCDNITVWELYSLLRATIKSTRTVGHLRLLINDQRIPRIVGKMLHAEWKQWSTRQPEWILEEVEEAFEKFVEEKWKDALNMAAAESASWEIGVAEPSQAAAWEDCDI